MGLPLFHVQKENLFTGIAGDRQSDLSASLRCSWHGPRRRSAIVLRIDGSRGRFHPDNSFAESAHIVQEIGQLLPLTGKGIFYLGRYLIVIDPGDQSISFQQLKPIRQDRIADIFQVVFTKLKSVIPLLYTE